MQALRNKTVVVVGGASGIGRAIVDAASGAGADLIISSRNREKLTAVAEEVGDVRPIAVDMTDAWSVEAWAAQIREIDHLVITASSAVHGPFSELKADSLHAMFDAKFFGPYRTAQAVLDKFRNGGSITFFSGVLSRRPGKNCSGLGAVNGAVESLTRALALELGPRLRVNCVSPGMIRSEAYQGMPEAAREAMYRDTGHSLPLQRVGDVKEAAGTALYLMSNGFTTGTVLDVDGGHMVRQYAMA